MRISKENLEDSRSRITRIDVPEVKRLIERPVNIDVGKVILSRDDRLSSGTMVDKR